MGHASSKADPAGGYSKKARLFSGSGAGDRRTQSENAEAALSADHTVADPLYLCYAANHTGMASHATAPAVSARHVSSVSADHLLRKAAARA